MISPIQSVLVLVKVHNFVKRQSTHQIEVMFRNYAITVTPYHLSASWPLTFQALHVNQLSTEEQRELASSIAPDTDKYSAAQRAKYAELRLEQLAETKDKELSLYTQLIENLVFLLWRHVQYYTVYCKDPTEGVGGEPLPKKLLSANQDYIKNVRYLIFRHLEIIWQG